MRVFLSWSGDRSRQLANVLREWLPSVLQAVEPFMSMEDIPKGTQWAAAISGELKNCGFAVICVTPENQHAPWLNYEAGALSNVLGTPQVCPLLLGVSSTDIDGPLSIFQMTDATEADVLRLVRAMNKKLSPPLSDDQLDRTYSRWWPDLRERLDTLASAVGGSPSQVRRTTEDLVRETLDAVREQSRLLTTIVETVTPTPRRTRTAQSLDRALADALNVTKIARGEGPIPEPGMTVRHAKWGLGKVFDVSKNGNGETLITVHFPSVGMKVVAHRYAPLEIVEEAFQAEDIDGEERDEDG